ncbi:hypothetical protein BC829DRAFT_17445 [Chytridium lagenaria]|nr:hypothetical protein BC829DRAFT_17445 [Chytridium lagenaria]
MPSVLQSAHANLKPSPNHNPANTFYIHLYPCFIDSIFFTITHIYDNGYHYLFSVLLVIIAIAAGLIVYRRRRNSSLVDAQAKSPSSIPARSISSPNIQPLPTTRRTFPPGSTSNLKQVNGSFFSFDPNLAEESRAELPHRPFTW